MGKTKYKRILLKLSGESLGKEDATIDGSKLNKLVSVLKKISSMGVEVGIVIGGGNIFRGKLAEEMKIEKTTGDSMGMLSTVINALAIQSVLKNNGIGCKVLSAFSIEGIVEKFTVSKTECYFKNKNIIVFAGGTGNPFFTTDTCSSLRALETKCQAILMGKNGAKGIYDKDPNKYKDAKFLKKLTFKQLLEKDLGVMDLTAVSLIKNSDLNLHVFDIGNYQNIVDILNGKDIGSVVKKGE